jgi:hypothetical protein
LAAGLRCDALRIAQRTIVFISEKSAMSPLPEMPSQTLNHGCVTAL